MVLESGIAATSLSWALVQPKIASFTRVCSYDRAGLGWSTSCSKPRTIEQMVFELNTLLAQAQISFVHERGRLERVIGTFTAQIILREVA